MMGTVTDFIFLGSKITADGDCSHEIKRHLLLGRILAGALPQSISTHGENQTPFAPTLRV